jgi:hypothetical protein
VLKNFKGRAVVEAFLGNLGSISRKINNSAAGKGEFRLRGNVSPYSMPW